jgi:hypothetical protein
MGIDLAITTLWAELATWKPSALEVITRAEYWAIRGASRMGRAVTEQDRYDDAGRSPQAIAAGLEATRRLVALLGKTEPAMLGWTDAAPRPADAAQAGAAPESVPVARIEVVGLDLLLAVAHAMQAASVARDVGEPALRALTAEPPRAPQRSQGPMSALLAASTSTLWIPVALEHAWDGPFGTVASMERLRADLAALPRLLHEVQPDAPKDLLGAQLAVEALHRALEAAAGPRCVRMAG